MNRSWHYFPKGPISPPPDHGLKIGVGMHRGRKVLDSMDCIAKSVQSSLIQRAGCANVLGGYRHLIRNKGPRAVGSTGCGLPVIVCQVQKCVRPLFAPEALVLWQKTGYRRKTPRSETCDPPPPFSRAASLTVSGRARAGRRRRCTCTLRCGRTWGPQPPGDGRRISG